MLRITKESEYAFLLLGEMLKDVGTAKSAVQLANSAKISLAITAKVLKQLLRGEIVVSTRGAKGGYELAKPPELITALNVVQAIEGSPRLVKCASGVEDCALIAHCVISPFWQFLNNEIADMLKKYSLAEMILMGANKK